MFKTRCFINNLKLYLRKVLLRRKRSVLTIFGALLFTIIKIIRMPLPLYDGILSDPRDIGLCSGCCTPLTQDKNVNKTVNTTDIRPGGYFIPSNCVTRERVAIIVPYRDREQHLKIFLNFMHNFLMAQQLEYAIFVVELALPTKFNRGLLVNIGVSSAMYSGIGFSCYVIHDVDLLPLDDRNLYLCSGSPRHMSSSNSKFNNSLPYHTYVGGVISFTHLQFKAINGFSNMYFGWGGEDDDLRKRISHAGYELHRVPFEIGRYDALFHAHDKKNPVNPDRYDLLKAPERRMNTEGLNSLHYKLLTIEKRPLYTWIYVQINYSDYGVSSSSPLLEHFHSFFNILWCLVYVIGIA